VVQTKQVAREKHKRKKKVEGQQRRRAKDAADKEMLRRKTTAGTRNLEELTAEEYAYTFSPRSADLLAPQKDYSESVSEGTLRPSSVGMFLHETKWPAGVTYRQVTTYTRLEELERRVDTADEETLARVRHEMDQAHLLEGKGLRDIHFGVVHNIKQYIIEQTRGLQEAADVSVMPSPTPMELDETSEESLSADAASALAFLSSMEPPSVKQELAMTVVVEDKPALPLLQHDTPANDLRVPLQHGFIMIGTANFGDVLILMSVNSSDNPSLCLFSLKEPSPGDTVTTRRQFVLLEQFLSSLEKENSPSVCLSVRQVEADVQVPERAPVPGTASADARKADATEEPAEAGIKRKREQSETPADAKPPRLKKPRLEDDDDDEEVEEQKEQTATEQSTDIPTKAQEERMAKDEASLAQDSARLYALDFPEEVCRKLESVNIATIKVEQSDASGQTGCERLDLYAPNANAGMRLMCDSSFAKLRSLTSLSLARCNLVELPDGLGALRKLEYLFLSNNRLTSLSSGDNPKKLPRSLRLLDISRNSITRLDLPELPQLRCLKASNNDISQLGESFGMLMASLEHLDLQRNRLEIFPATLCCCVSLTYLFLNDNCIEFLPPELGLAMPNLELLDISRNRILTTAGLETATKLRIIRAGQNQISQLPNWSEMLTSLAELTVLDLHQNQIVDLPPIDTHYQLECLTLRKNPLQFLPMRYYQLPMLRRLDLRSVSIGVLPPEVGCLNSLTSLLLRDTGIKSLPHQLKNLTLLTELDLGYNHMGHIPDCVFQCHSLRSLELLYNSIVTLPDSIGDLENLMYLDMSRNKVEQLPAGVRKLKELRQLDVSCNKLSQIAAFTNELPNLTYCNFTYNKLTREEKNALKKRFAV